MGVTPQRYRTSSRHSHRVAGPETPPGSLVPGKTSSSRTSRIPPPFPASPTIAWVRPVRRITWFRHQRISTRHVLVRTGGQGARAELVGLETGAAVRETVLMFPKTAKIDGPAGAAAPLPGVYLKKIKTLIQGRDACIPALTAALPTIVKTWQQAGCRQQTRG